MPARTAPPSIGPAELRALGTKYERISTLRALHLRARADARFVEPDPREEMASLAAEFPGALREMDELPFEVIHDRMSAIDAALGDPSRVERWMIAQARFHALARGALVAKRWLARRRDVGPDLAAEFDRELDGSPRAAEGRLWRDELARVATPPRGRLMDLVHERLAGELGVTVREARALVFGSARRPGGRTAG